MGRLAKASTLGYRNPFRSDTDSVTKEIITPWVVLQICGYQLPLSRFLPTKTKKGLKAERVRRTLNAARKGVLNCPPSEHRKDVN